ncbi:A24 family peptidase [Varunaivibrio sulfuroxidans]|uniref:Prepilin peptidase CpaA n=1 Tax=Varunaivibrio sulfuroxidans TaxID=1773489 RepID=A0A4R3JEX7_9PROT|nr:prepilin peptidase [Varunaivibrio sulfuroxidans]TCS64025.1 prepilin peptidase CpaA [Varunaivibrio sulfuroxidans]WES31522.1 prepilin peptidase [Varunaivibrio sulfuroxidans]
MFLPSVFAVVFAALLVYGALCDIRALRIPNWVSLALAGAFLPAAVVVGMGGRAIAIHYGIAILVLALLSVLFALGVLGGGDVKLFSAAAVWMGGSHLPIFALSVALAGGGLSALILIGRAWLRAGKGCPAWLAPRLAPGGAAPYGVAIAAGGLYVLPRLFIPS